MEKIKKTMFQKITENHYEKAIEEIAELVSIDSTYDEASIDEQNPFGKRVSEALLKMENIAKNDGFIVNNYSNKVIEILYGNEPNNVTILAHLDVVPVSGTWTSDPFKLRRTKTHLYARGVADDKGPLIAAYEAIKALRENDMIKGYQVRLLVGGNEESGSLGMKYYFETLKKPQPTYGFSPDANWPLIFAEKGIFNYEIKGEISIPHIYEISGGVATNAVIERCLVVSDDPKLEEFIKKNSNNYLVDRKGDKLYFTIIGKSAHGSTPEIGLNAGMIALKSVAKYSKNDNLLKLVSGYLPLDGSGLDAANISEEMGHNTLNVGIISFKGKELIIKANFRYVETADLDEIKQKIMQNTPFSIKFGEVSQILHYPLDSALVTNLMKSYQEETGDYKSKPLAIGGGTYAKEADNIVAFGMEGEMNESRMHDADENIRLDNLKNAIAIYANAIDKLGKLSK
jgi:succinyl-diaminopimelate desuccinylase